MKAISLRQPWADLVVRGHKSIEFRSRSDPFRGECYIHASRKFDLVGYTWLLKRPTLPGYRQVYKRAWDSEIDPDFGALIGKVTIVDCLPVDKALEKYPDNKWLLAAGDTLGKRAFILESPGHFSPENYIPCRGKVFPLFFDPEIPVEDYYKAIRDDQPDMLGL